MRPALDKEHDLLAAEHALGVLEGSELRQARQLMLASPEFAEAVREWEHALARIAGEEMEQTPPDGLWERIAQFTESRADQAGVLELRQRLRVWRGVSFAAMATAAALVLFVALPQTPSPAPAVNVGQNLLLASLSSEETNASLSAAYDPDRRSLVVTPGTLAAASDRQYEVWIIPPGGAPVAVGLLASNKPQRLMVRSEIEPHFAGRSTLAISVEPIGGSPTGQPTGPVIAAGQFLSI